jgi:ATP-dependent Clp protease ATP-binding subunit ClpA
LREAPDLLRLITRIDTVEGIRERIGEVSPSRDKISTSVDLTFSEASKHVLNSADNEANQRGNRVITPEHILIGLVREENCIAQIILKEFGVTTEAVRQGLRKIATDIHGKQIIGTPVPNKAFQKAITDAIEEARLLHSMSATRTSPAWAAER